MSTPSVNEQGFQSAIYVYQFPVRIWHLTNAFAIAVLAVTGYFIASPLPSMPGQASDHFLMGYIRFAHFTAAYILIIGFVVRVYWAFVGNSHSREIFLLPLGDPRWWDDVMHEFKRYLFLEKVARKYVGHNPIATISIHIMFVWGILFMIFTGLALYGEGEGMSSWQYLLFSSWIVPLFGNPQDVHTYHHLVAWGIVIFVIIHVYGAVRDELLGNQSIMSTIVSGYRTFKTPGRPEDLYREPDETFRQ
ncbi:MAG: Ni/Fe-hydrogenase, b-type cytochrome subunit [Rhodomicrobium sp.]|jgi:Ni/Fe-hydrogenase 1 B-type cytochrome subunit